MLISFSLATFLIGGLLSVLVVMQEEVYTSPERVSRYSAPQFGSLSCRLQYLERQQMNRERCIWTRRVQRHSALLPNSSSLLVGSEVALYHSNVNSRYVIAFFFSDNFVVSLLGCTSKRSSSSQGLLKKKRHVVIRAASMSTPRKKLNSLRSSSDVFTACANTSILLLARRKRPAGK